MTNYDGPDRRHDDHDLKSMVADIRDTLIRLEPVCEDVKRIKKWKEGNGVPGAQFQLWVLWICFLGLLGNLMR